MENGMSFVDRALAYAMQAHAGQVRKYTGEPYINHPIAVAEIVKTVPHTDEMIAATYLHDVIEDCSVSYAEILYTFGSQVATMVWGLTDKSRPEDGNRAARKATDRAWLAGGSAEVQTIKCADMIHNTESIAQHDPSFWITYRAEKRLLLDVLRKADRTLWDRAFDQCHA
jgi:(p)ppGpp synthase/HD superfamily hydrolase